MMSSRFTPYALKGAFILIATAFAFIPRSFALDYYEILGVAKTATAQDIQKAYRKLAMKHHPDRLVGATPSEVAQGLAKFKDIAEAYEILKDTQQRTNDDGSGKDPEFFHRKAPSSDQLSRVQQLLSEMGKAGQLEPDELRVRLTDFNAVMSYLITSEDAGLYRQYVEVMREIAQHPKFATAPILAALMVTDVVQEFTFGLNMQLDYWYGGFDTNAIDRTSGQLFQHLAKVPQAEVGELLNELMIRANTIEKVNTAFAPQQVHPKFSLGVPKYVYQFAVEKKLITDAASLIQFTKEVAQKIFDDTTRDSIANVFLESQLGYTLSLLKQASYEEVLYIVSNLKQKSQGLAFEELVRSGRLARMNAEQVLQILKESQLYADFYKRNPKFGEYFTKMGQEIEARIQRASQAFVPDFQKMSPTYTQVRSFIEMSGLKFGHYTLSRVRHSPLAERDYGLALITSSAEATRKSAGPARLYGKSCRQFFN